MTNGALNLNNLNVDKSGRASFSGLSSGIDFKKTVDSIIAAKRLPVDSLETRVSDNEAKITALENLRALMSTLKNSLDNLRGAVSLGSSGNIFAAKQTFASTSRTDGLAPSAAANLIGASVTNAALAGKHSLEVRRVATAQKVGSTTFADQTATLGFAGSFDLTGASGTATVTIQATDTLQEIRDRINSANAGTSATGVSASIVQVSATAFVLVLTGDQTGQKMAFANETGGVLNSLGISADGGTTLSNELQTAQTARFTADGLLNPNRFESNLITDANAQLSALAPSAAFPGSFDLRVGASTVTVNYTATDTVNTLVANINTAITTAGAGNAVFDAGTSATLVADGSGSRLVLTNTSGAAISLTDTSALLGGLGVDNKLVIERNSNTVSDLFAGVTLTLFQAEEGTTISLDIEQNLSSVKTAIQGLVTAYNGLKSFINTQTAVDSTTGKKSADAGALFSSQTIANVESGLGKVLGSSVQGVNNGFTVLAQIGITFVDNKTLSDPSLADTLQLDETALDTALLNNPDDVRRMFAFNFSSSDPRVSLLGFTSQTGFNATGYKLNVNFDDRFKSNQVATQTVFTKVDAQTGGPAADGISAINFDSAVPSTVTSGQAFRYSYNGTTEDLTFVNLTTGTSETVNLTALIDTAAGTGSDLATGQSITANFATLGITVSLSGTNGFTRATTISDGTLDTTGLDVNTTMTSGTVATPASGMNKLTVDALAAAGAYNQTSGLLTLGVTSNAAGEAHFNTAAGIKFSVDGGPVAADITATNLNDTLPHAVGVYVNDGTTDVLVGTVSFNTLSSTAAGTGSLTIDLGTGLVAESSVVNSATVPMTNYRPAITNGSFDIRDSANTLLGTVNYLTTDSLTDLATKISAIAGVTATINDTGPGGTFQIEVVHDTNDAISLNNDTGGVLTQMNIVDVGNTVFSANVGGAANGASDGTATVNGNTIMVTNKSGAEGLKLFFNGNTDVSNIQLDYTVGLGTQFFFALDRMLDTTTGVVETDISGLKSQNTVTNERIQSMLDRLEIQRKTLTNKFILLETTLAKADRLRTTLQQTFSALFKSKN